MKKLIIKNSDENSARNATIRIKVLTRFQNASSHIYQKKFEFDEILSNYDVDYCSLEENSFFFFFIEIDNKEKLYEVDRGLVSSLTGHISISGKEHDPKYYIVDKKLNNDDEEHIILGKHVLAFKIII